MNGADAATGQLRPRALLLLGYAVLVVLALGIGLWQQGEALLEAWLVAFLVLAGLASASLGLLMIGHLLGETWLRPARGPLEAAASTLPLVAMLAIPLAYGLDVIYPWPAGPIPDVPPSRQTYFSEPGFLVRGAIILLLWIAIAILVTRRGNHPWVSAIGLALLAPTAAISAIDWVNSREPAWWVSGFAFAYTVTQLAGAMSLALLVAMLRPAFPDPRRFHSLQRAAVTLALLTLWVWFAQFLIVWMANIPNEVSWYLARMGSWLWLEVGIAIPALIGAIAILLPTEPGRWRLVAASVLLLVQYLSHMLWLIRPASVSKPYLTWADPMIWLGLGLLWALWYAAALHVYGGPFRTDPRTTGDRS